MARSNNKKRTNAKDNYKPKRTSIKNGIKTEEDFLDFLEDLRKAGSKISDLKDQLVSVEFELSKLFFILDKYLMKKSKY